MNSNNFFIQFMRLAKMYWCSGHKLKVRGLIIFLAILTVLQMIMAVLMTQWSAALFNTLEQHSMEGLLLQIGLLILLFFADMALTGTHLITKRNLQVSWRGWLTEYVFTRWMDAGRHYLVTPLPGEHDNPDGRIAEDCRVTTESAVILGHSLLYSILLLVGFTDVLWSRSGVLTIDLGFTQFSVHGHLVWIAIIYSALASGFGWLLGRPLTGATNARQSAEANFRASLLDAQENSQAIALIHAEECERGQFRNLFLKIQEVWNTQTKAWRNITMFGTGYATLSMAFPILISAPRYIMGRITLGSLVQSAQAFQHMTSALSWPANNMGGIAEWRASVERILSLLRSLEHVDQELAKTENRIQLVNSDRPVLAFHQVRIGKYEGTTLAPEISMEISKGEHVQITGNAITGAQLFRAIAGIRPWGSGVIELPPGRLFFMPPRPYLPTGTLRYAIGYPASRRVFTPEQIEEAMRLVGLERLIKLLDRREHWANILTPEEQQLLGMVRLLLNQPQWVFLQESFDALEPADEERMQHLIREQLPDATLLAIVNSTSGSTFYTRQLALQKR
ncbi:MAG: ABC transporter ATP-binding protein/permease [Proteobacteria bacterium]|nr:ABC transporter ATP-binding protein/permease [Pseudomonadota bacterium]